LLGARGAKSAGTVPELLSPQAVLAYQR
jgi:hypothetical protein